MSHSPAYYEHTRSSNSSFTAPRDQLSPRRPPHAYLGSNQEHLPNADHVKTSISSATSGSTDATDPRNHNPARPYQYGPAAERGHAQDRRGRHSQLSPAASHRVSNSAHGHREMVQAPPPTVIRYIQEDGDDEEEEKPDHAIWILFWMSCLDPLFSLFSCLFTIFTLLALVACSPVRLCKPDWSFSLSLIRTICPLYRKHLQLLYASSVDNAHNFEFSPMKLIAIHATAPLLSICFAFFSWIAAVFWLFAITMGNPDGTEKRDDGRATVLMARNRWERYLLLALRRR